MVSSARSCRPASHSFGLRGGTIRALIRIGSLTAPAGSYVIHYAGKVHYDGAKDGETVIQVWGMGPATAIPAEKR